LHIARGAGPLNTFGREGGGVGGCARATDDGVCNDCGGEGLTAPEPVRAPCCCLRKEGDMPVRLNMACISVCIDTGLRCPRVRTSAPSVGSVVVVAARDDFATFDEHGAEREAHGALGGRIGALREVELRLVHFIIGF